MYIRRKVFSLCKTEGGEERYFSLIEQREFGAHKRKQNLKLEKAVKNAEMQTGSAAKTQRNINRMVEILSNGGTLTGKYKDMYENGGYAKDVDAALKGASGTAEKVQKHVESANRDLGRTGDVATKMSKQRKSLAQGGELHIQTGDSTQVTGQGKNRKGGLKVQMKTKKTLGDVITGKKGKTVVQTEQKKKATQGSGKTSTQTVLNETQTNKVETAAKGPKLVTGTGNNRKEVAAPKNTPKPTTEIVASAPTNSVRVETPNTINEVVGNKLNTTTKKDAKLLGRNAKIGLGVAAGAAALGAGVYAYKKHKDNKTKEDKAALNKK